jgi:hypothetical protein
MDDLPKWKIKKSFESGIIVMDDLPRWKKYEMVSW